MMPIERRVGGLVVRVEPVTGDYRSGRHGARIVATADLSRARKSVAIVAIAGVFTTALPVIFALPFVLELFGGKVSDSGAALRLIVGVLAIVFSGALGLHVLRVLKDLIAQLRQPVVFRLDDEALHVAGEVLLRAVIEGVEIKPHRGETTTWSVVLLHRDGVGLILVSGLDDVEEARWLEAELTSALVDPSQPSARVPGRPVALAQLAGG